MSPHSHGAVCSPEAWAFARMEELWARFTPLTPYGKDLKEERLVTADRAAIERAYDDAQAFGAYMAARTGGVEVDRLSFHLGRLPRLPFSAADADAVAQLDLVDLFQVKKFVANYRAVSALLDDALRARFGLDFASGALAAALNEGGSDPETLFIADAMHPDLAGVRAAAAERSAALRAVRESARIRARDEIGLDFGAREFLAVPNEQARAVLADRSRTVAVAVEAYDALSCIVRLQDDEPALRLVEELDAVLARERELEAEVVARLSRMVAGEVDRLLAYADAIRALDLARARAVLAAELGLTRPALGLTRPEVGGTRPELGVTRPELGVTRPALGLARPELGSDALVVRGARFLPCQWDCDRLGLEYTPLDLCLDTPAAVLFGSNMGGKTVALQTLAFLQITVQTGLFVPADALATTVYPWIGYVGEFAGDRSVAARGGLSGFGFEIRSFVEAWVRATQGGAFLVFDELARTTSSAEAEAILSAAIEALAGVPRTRSVLATHYRSVARLPGVTYVRMLGLDRARAAQAMGMDEPLSERIRRINGLMRYRIVDDLPTDAERSASDATIIAALLGLDPGIVARADAFLRSKGDEPDRR